MNILLVNEDLTISKIAKLSPTSSNANIEEISSSLRGLGKEYDLLIINDDIYSSDIIKDIKQLTKFNKTVILASKNNKQLGKKFDFILLKPFLPSNFTELITKISSEIGHTMTNNQEDDLSDLGLENIDDMIDEAPKEQKLSDEVLEPENNNTKEEMQIEETQMSDEFDSIDYNEEIDLLSSIENDIESIQNDDEKNEDNSSLNDFNSLDSKEIEEETNQSSNDFSMNDFGDGLDTESKNNIDEPTIEDNVLMNTDLPNKPNDIQIEDIDNLKSTSTENIDEFQLENNINEQKPEFLENDTIELDDGTEPLFDDNMQSKIDALTNGTSNNDFTLDDDSIDESELELKNDIMNENIEIENDTNIDDLLLDDKENMEENIDMKESLNSEEDLKLDFSTDTIEETKAEDDNIENDVGDLLLDDEKKIENSIETEQQQNPEDITNTNNSLQDIETTKNENTIITTNNSIELSDDELESQISFDDDILDDEQKIEKKADEISENSIDTASSYRFIDDGIDDELDYITTPDINPEQYKGFKVDTKSIAKDVRESLMQDIAYTISKDLKDSLREGIKEELRVELLKEFDCLKLDENIIGDGNILEDKDIYSDNKTLDSNKIKDIKKLLGDESVNEANNFFVPYQEQNEDNITPNKKLKDIHLIETQHKHDSNNEIKENQKLNNNSISNDEFLNIEDEFSLESTDNEYETLRIDDINEVKKLLED
jgi:uncharacterized membrane protein